MSWLVPRQRHWSNHGRHPVPLTRHAFERQRDASAPKYNSPMRAILTLALFFSASIAAAQTPQYDVYAIRYATIPGFPVAGLIKGADESRKIDIAMMVWLVRGGGR